MQRKINVESATPIRQQTYRLPEARKIVKKELDNTLDQGIVQPSHSPWALPIVLLENKDGDVRSCVDYRMLNQVSKFDNPMAHIDEVLESVGCAQFISTLNLAKGYWQIPVTEEYCIHHTLRAFQILCHAL